MSPFDIWVKSILQTFLINCDLGQAQAMMLKQSGLKNI